METLSSINGVFHVSSQLSEGAPEGKIYINPKKAMDAGLNPKSVGSLIASINGA
ncbi:MAG: hypothetical protein K6E63_00990 [Lachnospiraceae bacterium]|nr:hypothetical protein [Lachnospiraceae bacterium]